MHRFISIPEPEPKNFLTWYVAEGVPYRDYVIEASRAGKRYVDRKTFWLAVKERCPKAKSYTIGGQLRVYGLRYLRGGGEVFG